MKFKQFMKTEGFNWLDPNNLLLIGSLTSLAVMLAGTAVEKFTKDREEANRMRSYWNDLNSYVKQYGPDSSAVQTWLKYMLERYPEMDKMVKAFLNTARKRIENGSDNGTASGRSF